jgi:hypothetical protein
VEYRQALNRAASFMEQIVNAISNKGELRKEISYEIKHDFLLFIYIALC